MNYRQLAGRANAPSTTSEWKPIIAIVVALAVIVGGLAWGYSTEPSDTAKPPVSAVPPTAAVPAKVVSDAEDRQLHLAHAQQELIRAAEQLAQARRLLAALSPALNRNYLATEKRRLDSAWAACDLAQRAVEQARGDIAMFTAPGKEQP